jgi:hypothetical protein
MKPLKLLFLGLLTLCFSNLNAQLFVGGSISFQVNATNATPHRTYNYSFDLTPSAGKFLSDKLAVGAGLHFSVTVSKRHNFNNTIETVSTTTTGGMVPEVQL